MGIQRIGGKFGGYGGEYFGPREEIGNLGNAN